ncbi:WecB/TagA/CpsF family glycosyltransferase [Specibacter sp. RAF43]|uniref:WecB/TagA/CpsF family glycosyltransferase n=1 Tax=Specibacter sp. RAF43 TaxID=3233057 RepID=UPI003F9522C5
MDAQFVTLGGIQIDLLPFDEAVRAITGRATTGGDLPLCVVSVNLDHIHHFGFGGRWHGSLEGLGSVEFLNLIDGAPLVAQARRVSGRRWPRLAGSDLIAPLLDAAEREGLRIGFLGGSPATQAELRNQLATRRPRLAVAGWWSPERSELADPATSEKLAADIAAHQVDMLVVGLGKPRQELWMARYGAATGAPVLLGFGAAVDFLAGNVRRAPDWVSRHGFEWAWRLALEPSRLARRYLVDGPSAYVAMRRFNDGSGVEPLQRHRPTALRPVGNPTPGKFAPAGTPADIAVVVVTYNNADSIDALIASLRDETFDQRLRVVVADNSPTDETLQRLAPHPDVLAFSTGGNLGYAGAINVAATRAGDCQAVLILNPDLTVDRGALATLLARMTASGAGAVVPLLHDDDGSLYHSLRREPTLARAAAAAVLGSHLAGRPGWLAEIDADAESYQHPHRIDWATGAAILIRHDVAESLGRWDEQYFLYSEETDYFRRIRNAGHSVWFEPAAVMRHSRGGSGSSAELVALMAVNRVRYAASHHGRAHAAAVRAVTAAAEFARSYQPSHRVAAKALLGIRRWESLPGPSSAVAGPAAPAGFPSGSVIIPAHNEASVIGRTLAHLAPLAAEGQIEVIVACNGCTDDTAARADLPGVTVLNLAQPSKTAALNAADGVATAWPRVYLDADIELTRTALREVLEHLAAPGALAARPPFIYDASSADPLVRAYYRARTRIPEMGTHLWGAGVYALSAEGRGRFADFPSVTGDDAFVDSLFTADEIAILPTEPVVVHTPRSARTLSGILRRVYRGNLELEGTVEKERSGLGVRGLVKSVQGPLSAIDALLYASIALVAKTRARQGFTGWERDDDSRSERARP